MDGDSATKIPNAGPILQQRMAEARFFRTLRMEDSDFARKAIRLKNAAFACPCSSSILPGKYGRQDILGIEGTSPFPLDFDRRSSFREVIDTTWLHTCLRS